MSPPCIKCNIYINSRNGWVSLDPIEAVLFIFCIKSIFITVHRLVVNNNTQTYRRLSNKVKKNIAKLKD